MAVLFRLFTATAVATAAAMTYPAVSSLTQWQGRYLHNADDSATFDWPGVRVRFRVQSTTTISVVLSSPGTTKGQIRVFVDGHNVSTLNVDSTSTSYPVISGLSATVMHDIELYNVLEPALLHPQPFLPSPPYQALTLSSINVDGSIVDPPAQLSRRLVFVGDSITAGFGAQLESAQCGPDNPTFHEANDLTYGNLLCANFTANCSIIAWSGKGLYVNSPTAGTVEVMPQYYMQTTGAGTAPYTADWDFSRFVPDAVIINLGTNDYGHNHDTGPAWEANFTKAVVNFMTNLTVFHSSPRLPIFAAVGPLTTKPASTIKAAIATFNGGGGNAFYLDIHGPVPSGCNGHPGPRGHQEVFAMAQPQIAAVLGWR